ncbi:MAG TPA: hypothetical protein VNY73_07810 [Bacteroidia bacterium]|jgi:hypothetical protein|nr:hypothetical protein [Bacteroidia bacterium]
MYKVVILMILLFPTLILLNFGMYRYVVNKAIKKHIKPKLQSAGLTFTDYKWLGFFNHGDFKNDRFILLPSVKGGYPVIATYIDVFYYEASVKRKVTVRIDTFFIYILRVLYSSEF